MTRYYDCEVQYPVIAILLGHKAILI